MKSHFLAAALATVSGFPLLAQSMSLTYQGRLKAGGVVHSGLVDLRFGLWDQPVGGALLDGPQTRLGIEVVDGLFSVALDFDPAVFAAGANRYLEIEVALPAGSNAFAAMPQRELLTVAPYTLATRGLSYDAGAETLVVDDPSVRVGIGTRGPQGALHTVHADAARDEVAVFENLSGRADAGGIRIKIDNGSGSTNRGNRFVTFVNGSDAIVGRIEGFDRQNMDWRVLPPVPRPGVSIATTVGRLSGVTLDRGRLPAAMIDPGRLPSMNLSGGQFPRLNCTPGSWPSIDCTGGRWPIMGCTAGSWPSLSCSRGRLPSMSMTRGSLPTVTWVPAFFGGIALPLPSGLTFSRGSLPQLTWDPGQFPDNCTLNGGSFPACTVDRRNASFPFCAINPRSGSFPGCSLSGGLGSVFAFDPGVEPSVTWTAGRLPRLTFDDGALPTIQSVAIAPPQLVEIQSLACWAIEDGVQQAIPLIAAAGLLSVPGAPLLIPQLVTGAMQTCLDEGVIYGSGGADYAEWLPKEDPRARFQIGQVVGVRGGKVSLRTDGAEQIMVVSCKPCVLGNAPPDAKVSDYVKVAFMGQVPVVVRGRVRAGDCILPSGHEDGTAIAVAGAELEDRDLARVLGRAWSESSDDVYGMVNVVVGVEGHEVATALRRRAQRIRAQRDEIAALERAIDALRRRQTDARDRLDALSQAVTSGLANTSLSIASRSIRAQRPSRSSQ